ncbi:MAG: anaerobic ribonucleoside-triphosphate reductase activating protein [Oscillospiraceae bacterium]|nr:anaerobic ribonucleoside-triphosphate reductase activating protein [Oscillospiraceae bacterium]
MEIAGLAPNSTVDYPGILAAVLFTSGCNMDCFYCHNRKLINKTLELTAEDTVFAFLQKRSGFLDGVVISGGEPTIQKDLVTFVGEIKRLGYKVKLDTNGSEPAVVQELLAGGLLDYVAVDYKAPWRRYKEICNYVRTENVQKTLEVLKNSEISWEARTTMLPHITREEYIEMAREMFILPRYVINQYRIPEDFLEVDRPKMEVRPHSKDFLLGVEREIKSFQPNVILCGV